MTSFSSLVRFGLSRRPTRHNIGHFGGGLHSQSLDWYWQTKQYMKIQINKLNTNQKSKQPKIQQNETTLVPLPLTTLGQETRWAYSTMPPSPHGAPFPSCPFPGQPG